MQLHRSHQYGTWLWLGWLVVAFGLGLWTGRFGLPSQGKDNKLLSASLSAQRSVAPRLPQRTLPPRSREQKCSPQRQVCPKPKQPVQRIARIQDLPYLAWERFPIGKRRQLLALLNQLRTPCSCGQTLAQCAQVDLKQCHSLRAVLGQVMQLVYTDTPEDIIRRRIRTMVPQRSTTQPAQPQAIRPRRMQAGRVYHVQVPTYSPGYGSSHAKLTVMIFSDFVCPNCWDVMKQVKQLETKYGAKEVRVVFRHFPLSQHPRAWLAAEAAQAAHAQGKFWAYHHLLFSNPSKLGLSDLKSYASKAKLNTKKFIKALQDRTYQSVVQRDVAMGLNFKLPGIPFVFINGLPVMRRSQMSAVAQQAWSRAEALLKRGTPRYALYRTLIKYGRREP